MSLWFWLACTPPDEAPQPQDNHSITESSTDSATDTSAPDSATDSDWVRQVDVYLEDFLVLETNQPAKVTDCTVQDCTDDDQDGLTDAWEQLALEAFHPLRILDEDEPALTDDTAVLADVGRVFLATDGQVRVFVMLGWSRDYGRCGVSAHNGDSERVALDVRLEGSRAVVQQVYTAAHEGTAIDHGTLVKDLSTLTVTAEPRWAVFPSEGKHATYPSVAICEGVSFVPCVDEDCAPDGVSDPTDYEVLPPVFNAGEPAHPLLTDLDSVGYPGDHAWSEQRFCGGLSREDSCSSPVAEKLLTDPF